MKENPEGGTTSKLVPGRKCPSRLKKKRGGKVDREKQGESCLLLVRYDYYAFIKKGLAAAWGGRGGRCGIADGGGGGVCQMSGRFQR